MKHQVDVAVLGAGFGGSLMALILHQLGYTVTLIERGQHPRFAIGESSTPLANLIWKNLTEMYDLPALTPLVKYGTWRQHYPDLPVGLKRGFSFYHHQSGQPFRLRPDHANALLVAASKRDETGDTHWFRADFDHWLVQHVQTLGIPYFDQTTLTKIAPQGSGWHLAGHRSGQPLTITARFVFDASGQGQVLPQVLNLKDETAQVRTRSWAVYTHFSEVGLWADSLTVHGEFHRDDPFPCDAAALHHLWANGWMWQLRFDHGVTSAGLVFADDPPMKNPAQIWEETLQKFPAMAAQFSGAILHHPLQQTQRLQRSVAQVAGPNWALLPHTAYFLDPLMSTGIAHTLWGIERLAAAVAAHGFSDALHPALWAYQTTLHRERDFIDRVLHGLYQALPHFRLFTAFSMYYFASAIAREHRRMTEGIDPATSTLLLAEPAFYQVFDRAYQTVLHLTQAPSISDETCAQFEAQVAEDIAPYNIAGLCDPAKQNRYPYI